MKVADWQALWPQALALWSPHLRLHEPLWLQQDDDIHKQDFQGKIAAIKLTDQRVLVNLAAIESKQLQDYALEILAHEIGHHVYAPANMKQQLQLLSCIHQSLPGAEQHSAFVANLFSDLLINHHLQRHTQCRLDKVYQTLNKQSQSSSPLWELYMGIYEQLWQLPATTLTQKKLTDAQQGDAILGSRIIKVYGKNWLTGSSRFAMLMLPYLEETNQESPLHVLIDTLGAGENYKGGGIINLPTVSPIHPNSDDKLNSQSTGAAGKTHSTAAPSNEPQGQCIEPLTYQAVMAAAGTKLNQQEIVVQYYRDLVQPYLLPFPKKIQPAPSDTLFAGHEQWEIGDDPTELDWVSTAFYGKPTIPGITTRKILYEPSTDNDTPKMLPFDLDLYVDSSGSMPNPAIQLSYPTLAGVLLCVSALRAGAKVKVTLWSSADQCTSTDGFIDDEQKILAVLTGYFGGATAFPLHVLRDTYAQPRERPTQIVVLSDDGVDTLYQNDEQGNSGASICATALKNSQGAGHLVLELYYKIEQYIENNESFALAKQQGWQMYRVEDLPSMLDFARQFANQYYGSI